MTLILSALTKGYAFQAGDRLVSTQRGATLTDHDTLANKQIVLLAADALVSFGYTGLAYINGVPTDRWLAEQITAQQLDSGGFFAWSAPGPMHLHAVVLRLVDSLQQAFQTLPVTHQRVPLDIDIVGLSRRRRNRARPLLWSIQHLLATPTHFTLRKADLSQFRWDASYRASIIPAANIDSEVVDALRASLKRDGEQSPDMFTQLLVDAIRATGGKRPGIGRDCMVVRLCPGAGLINIDVEYLPELTQHVSLERGPTPVTVPAAYSPWVLLPTMSLAPMVLVKDQTWHSGDIKVRLRAPDSATGFTFTGSQPRMPPPRV